MKQRLSPNGFAAPVILLALAALLVVGGIGAYLYTQQPSKKTPTNTADTTLPAPSSTSPNGIPAGATGTPPPTAHPASTDVTVTISGAGFQITVPASLRDLTYRVNGGQVTFSTATLTAAVPSCSANSGSGAFETITRGNGTYKPPANPADGGLLKQYGDYYLAYTLRTGPCAKGLSVANQNLLDDQTQAFYGALSTVK
jgi:hypothetical protein